MKRFYIILCAIPVLSVILVYLPIWWFVGAILAVLIFIAYQYFATHLDASESRKEVLENELDEMHERLEQSYLKEQKTSREAAQIREMKQQLLSVISHEIRTPMNGIMGMTQVLHSTPLNNEQQEYLKTIRDCGEGLLITVNNILANDIIDFSKLQNADQKLEYKDFDLVDAVEEVLGLFAARAANAGLELLCDIDDNVPPQIIGDNKRVRQVLMNIVENAVKFTHKGEVIVGVHYSRHTTAGYPPELSIAVTDTGIGMTDDQIKGLFTGIPGTQIAKSSEHGGAGLGLVVCRKLVELMGGKMDAKSEAGLGTVVRFTIPVTPALKIIKGSADTDETKIYEGKRILIVDINTSSRNMLVKRLKNWKMIPVAVESGVAALQAFTTEKFDLVLSEMTLPIMDGVQLSTSLKEKYAGIPVIGMTNAIEIKSKSQLAQFNSVLQKPLRSFLLKDHIADAMQKASVKDDEVKPLAADFAKHYPLRILVAEDNLINQKIISKLLSNHGYEATVANNGKEALEVVSLSQYDLILMDVQMPEMDGLEATRMIRTCLDAQPVIIALTANAMQGDRDLCMQAGMDDYMSKPVELKELLSQLEKWSRVLRERKAAI